ncbi:MAG: RNA polymerase sigma factor [Betaproteobacteria bacterium]
MDDAALVARALAGDCDAFAVLVREHGSAILRLALRMLPSRESAEDLAQETFLRAYSSLAKYDARYPFRPWLYRIASNLCIDALRRRRAEPPSVSMDEVPEGTVLGRGAAAAGGVGSWTPRVGDPVLESERAEVTAAVRAAVRDLAPEYRLLVVMAHFEGMKNDEIAQATGLSPSIVKNRLYRARRMLRQKLSGLMGAGVLDR